MEPDPTNSLAIIIQFSIGLAGFVGIVSIFSGPAATWVAVDRFRLGIVLSTTFLAGFLAFIALALDHMMGGETAWKTTSAIFIIIGIIVLSLSARALLRLPADQRDILSNEIIILFFGGSIINIVFQLVNSLGVFGHNAFSILFFGLIWLLVIPVIQFIRLIFIRPRVSSKDI